MTYKGYTIAAEERTYKLIEVDDDGTIGTGTMECWARDYSFRVIDADNNPIDTNGGTLEEAKAFIDELEAES
jgi:hypothetical protein